MHQILSFSCFLSYPQRYARWVGAEHVDRMLPDMHLQEVGEVIMPDAPQPPGITITMLGVPALLPVLVTLHPLSTTSMVTKVSSGVCEIVKCLRERFSQADPANERYNLLY